MAEPCSKTSEEQRPLQTPFENSDGEIILATSTLCCELRAPHHRSGAEPNILCNPLVWVLFFFPNWKGQGFERLTQLVQGNMTMSGGTRPRRHDDSVTPEDPESRSWNNDLQTAMKQCRCGKFSLTLPVCWLCLLFSGNGKLRCLNPEGG